jgi:antitoxin component of MazEF toxin-antitoxin module
MKAFELKVSRIGNSRGVRLPAASLRRYRIGAAVLMEERSEGIFLRPIGPAVEKLSWEDTAREMAASLEDWGEWDSVTADGLEGMPWETGEARTIAEKKTRYHSGRQSAKKP